MRTYKFQKAPGHKQADEEVRLTVISNAAEAVPVWSTCLIGASRISRSVIACAISEQMAQLSLITDV